MITKEQILAALKKLGPSSPTAVANSMGAEPSAIGYHLRNMLAAKTVKAAGTSNDRVYALPDQDMEGVKSAPPQQRKKPGKRRKAKKANTPRARSAAAIDAFLPAITAELGLVICNGMQAPQGGIGAMLQAMLGYGGMGGGPARVNYRSGGYTVAHGKRMARKRRNQLRAKGQFRRAVR